MSFFKIDDQQLLLKTISNLESGMLETLDHLPIFATSTPIRKQKGIPNYKNDPIWETGYKDEEVNELENMVKRLIKS